MPLADVLVRPSSPEGKGPHFASWANHSFLYPLSPAFQIPKMDIRIAPESITRKNAIEVLGIGQTEILSLLARGDNE